MPDLDKFSGSTYAACKKLIEESPSVRVTRTTLWFNDWILGNTDITLSDDFRNYDYIEFWLIRTISGRQLHSEIYPVDMLNTLYKQQVTGGVNQMVFTFYGGEYSSWEFTSATQLHFLDYNSIFVGKIVGVKLGGVMNA